MGKLEGKIALITGGTSGIGAASANLFAEEGAEVIIVGRDESRGNSLVSEVREKGGHAEFVRCDVTDSKAIAKMKNKVEAEYGGLDCMVNCAGTWDAKVLNEIDDVYWDETMRINATSLMYMTRAFYPLCCRSHGNIVNVASIGGLQSHIAGRGQYAYSAAKAAAIQFSQLCALNFAPEVRVNVVCPGPTDTPIYTNKDYSRFNESIPMRRVGKPEETAKAILFLASSDASYITGAVLTVDGGASIK